MWIDISWRQPQKLWEKLEWEMTLRQEKKKRLHLWVAEVASEIASGFLLVACSAALLLVASSGGQPARVVE